MPGPTDIEDTLEAHAEGLTDEQAEAYWAVGEGLLRGDLDMARISGYAGVGKTFVAGRLCRAFQDADVELTVAAPTHRAAREIERSIGAKAGVSGKTIHSVLGLQLEQDGQGGYHLVREEDDEDGPPAALSDGGIVVCDEASMIGEELWGHIQESGTHAQWLFLGDPAQLPPVDEEPGGVFDLPGHELTTVVRQARQNPIIDVATRIRQGEPFLRNEVIRFENGEGVGVTRSEQALIESAAEQFRNSRTERRGETGRVLAFTNRKVDEYNRRIRRAVEGDDAPEYVEGEWLVVDDTWYRDEMPVLINAEMVQVLEREKVKHELGLGGQWMTWRLLVETPSRGEKEIQVLADEDRERYRETVENAKEKAKAAGDSGSWRQYYRLREQYAQVSYGFASTVHKAQGATFDTAFVDLRNINNRARGSMRRKLAYVAATRPRHRLAIRL
jgi:exodeoxyribonuclease-5